MKKTFLLLLMTFIAYSGYGQIMGTTTYDFRDGSILPTDGSSIDNVSSSDGALTIDKGAGSAFKFNDGSHGGQFKDQNVFSIQVANKATLSFSICVYSAEGATLELKNESGETLSTISASLKNVEGATDGDLSTYTFNGSAQTLTAMLSAGGSVYIHYLTVTNEDALPGLEGMTQVWDFGAEQLSSDTYMNVLDVDAINAWYVDVAAGTAGLTLPDFTADVLTWEGKETSDRLRTSNESLTRYDSNVSSDVYTGRVYANGTVSLGDDGLPTTRYFAIELAEDDEVTVVALSQNGTGNLTFVTEEDVAIQKDQQALTNAAAEYNFIAGQAGVYRIYDETDKLSVFRVLRKNADYVTISGVVDETNAPSISEGYGIVFTNSVTGKSWTSVVASQAYSIDLPAGHTYNLSLSDANGYIITGDQSIDVTTAATVNMVVEQIALNTVSGSISGLGDDLANLELVYTPDPAQNKVYEPEVTIDVEGATYTVVLEPNCEYSIAANGVNDYIIGSNTITVTEDITSDITFTAKPVYDITITTEGLSNEAQAALGLIFTNLNEQGYSYSFGAGETIQLRDGTYQISAEGIDDYAVKLSLTSNLTVNEAAADKTLSFEQVTKWDFDEKNIESGATSYFGLIFSGTGSISNQAEKSHLVGKDGAVINVPVSTGNKVIVSYYYTAQFNLEGTDYSTESKSTSTVETAEYIYEGTEDGVVTITIGSTETVTTTYFTSIEVVEVVDYTDVITVGADKDFQSINGALDYIAKMNRTSDQRVTVMIDPGNYEEMLVIDQPNITFENVSATPSIALVNKGVDIDANAVRITSYYGHGYSYYSMGSDQKWDADVLRVNKENGYLSYDNAGSGTTNGSYWNATVVVSAEGFTAKDIIFENSYNQYISQKEAEDMVVEWSIGGKGTRPTEAGSTDVQDKSFVERAAAIAITSGGDKTVLVGCRVVGRQDSFYGSKNARVVVYKGDMMGATDYIFGGMIAVFYKSNLVLNTSDDSNDVAYITAAQQESGRGYLMYECTIKSAELSTETASTSESKPGYFGRPWAPTTSEVVFYNTTINATTNSSFNGQSLIMPEGWKSTLGGESAYMYEYGTIENSGEDNSGNRASWSTLLSSEVLLDDTEISTYNFTKGSDEWDPIPGLIADDPSTGFTVQEKVKLKLMQNVPNPAIANTIITYQLEESADVFLTIYNSTGGVVKIIKDGYQLSGSHQINLSVDGLSSGMYFYSMKAGSEVLTKKMLVK
ncbi:pectinesterase family protein [Carboxylicivirga linearis]|uniref:T9SS type A sorting domain-containing protein n=1 Tax=Carboxylicivirga linearis TaxID=1628157 RepID=A0ABS5JSG7_9BACT|nr:pectinesterase family protein [Carboxylicivirga linearis]MBS2097815.1 T9SS type A sorting domain-containing protein [Carboxylicivirga linearis]